VPCRLASVPQGVLWLIARKMGRRSRALSRALLHAYGPLDCSLAFSGSAAYDELQRVLGGSSSGQRLQLVTSLQLVEQWGEECEADLVASIVAKLPNLQSLALTMAPPDLSLLARLRNTLTALDVQLPPHAFDSGDAGLSLLTNLRSLTFTGDPDGGDGVACQHLLGSLPQLVRLNAPSSAWNPQWLAGLGSRMPHLTSLALGYPDKQVQHAWDAVATAAVQQSLTGLRSLSLCALSLTEPSAIDTMVEALAHCTWLESVHLFLHVGPSNPAPNMLQLSSLRLASLAVRICAHADPLVAALHALTHLTKLRLAYHQCTKDMGVPQLPSSLVELHLLGDWQPSSPLPPLQALPSLRVLNLRHGTLACEARWTPEAAQQLAKLTQLHSLSVAIMGPRLLLPHLSGLSALRELRLTMTERTGQDEVADRDLQHLLPLQELVVLCLGNLQRVSAAGVLALLEALPNLQQLELTYMMQAEVEGAALVEGLLPRVLPHLTRLELVGVQLPGHARDALLSAAEAHGCRCTI
jgi:hypothetical protein